MGTICTLFLFNKGKQYCSSHHMTRSWMLFKLNCLNNLAPQSLHLWHFPSCFLREQQMCNSWIFSVPAPSPKTESTYVAFILEPFCNWYLQCYCHLTTVFSSLCFACLRMWRTKPSSGSNRALSSKTTVNTNECEWIRVITHNILFIHGWALSKCLCLYLCVF